MPVKSLKTDIIDKNNLSEKQKINSETGYFGTKVSNPE